MKDNAVEIQRIIVNQCFTQKNIDFLNDFYNRKNKIKDELKSIEEKKIQIVNFICENKQKVENGSKQARQYINSAESVMECVERISGNLNEVLNLYKKIENSFVIIYEKIEFKLNNYCVEEDIKDLSDEIAKAIELEKNNSIDNKNNYLIIDSFFNQTFNIKTIEENTQDFSDLTMDNLEDHMVLKICEKKVELPYTKKEIGDYLSTYPKNYKTVQDVLNKEYIVNISLFNKHPVLARFRETYYLCRTKEMMSIFDSFNYAKSLMFRSDLNSYIIAAVKSKKQLEDYIYCLDNDKLHEYKHFKIIFNVNPIAI